MSTAATAEDPLVGAIERINRTWVVAGILKRLTTRMECIWRVACDAGGCSAWAEGYGVPSAAAATLQAQGWFVDADRLYCPQHAT